jgi:D-amino-acid dehydrogenase
MACGSASVIADLVSGRAPAIDAGDLAVFRYAGANGAHQQSEFARA